MDNLEYSIVLKTPQGYRVGSTTVKIDNGSISGSICVLENDSAYCGSIDSNGNIEITGELHIFGESFCFKGNGKISFHAIHISIPHEDFTYELDGTVKR